SVNKVMIDRLVNFAEALEANKTISELYTCRRVVLDLTPTPYDPNLVRTTRMILNASQAMFAKFLGVKPKTVQSWEQGTDVPSDMACRFMDEIRGNPGYWLKRFTGALVRKKKPEVA